MRGRPNSPKPSVRECAVTHVSVYRESFLASSLGPGSCAPKRMLSSSYLQWGWDPCTACSTSFFVMCRDNARFAVTLIWSPVADGWIERADPGRVVFLWDKYLRLKRSQNLTVAQLGCNLGFELGASLCLQTMFINQVCPYHATQIQIL